MTAFVLMVGTSGWQYADWRGEFYPSGVPQRLWLEHYVQHFPTVEVNNAFYRLPEKKTFEQWRARTPDGFVVAVKMSRYLTHVKRLREPAEPVQRFFDRASALADRLGPVLLQLPPTLRKDLDSLDRTLAEFPPGVKTVVEFRHDSWFDDETRALLERRGAALCWADRKSKVLNPLWDTADFRYLRLHEGRAAPWPHYGRAALAKWLDRLGDGAQSYVFFNNDQHCAAPRDAESMRAMARRRGEKAP
jgi:uncharacterized protein YecE (DUF72 family)